jgi:hypothetical protein
LPVPADPSGPVHAVVSRTTADYTVEVQVLSLAAEAAPATEVANKVTPG